MAEKVKFTDSRTGEELEFFVVEETRINNLNYLLVTETETDEDAEAYILKDLSEDDEAEALYEFVEDDAEIEFVGKIFAELLDDIDIEN
jgi:hypothetical protein